MRPMRLPLQLQNFNCDAEMINLMRNGRFEDDDPPLDAELDQNIADRVVSTKENEDEIEKYVIFVKKHYFDANITGFLKHNSRKTFCIARRRLSAINVP